MSLRKHQGSDFMCRNLVLILFSVLCTTAVSSGIPQTNPIQYDDIQERIQDHIRSLVDGDYGDTETCPTVFCPDAEWRVSITSSFRFTEHQQPSLTPRSSSPGVDGYRMTVEAQGECTLSADAYIDIHGPVRNIAFDFSVRQFIGIELSATVLLLPEYELEPDSIDFSLTLDGSSPFDIQIEGVRGDLAVLGLEAGAGSLIVTLSPSASVFGGVWGAVTGYASADVAKKIIKAKIEEEIATMISEALTKITDEVQQHVLPKETRSSNAAGSVASLISSLLILSL